MFQLRCTFVVAFALVGSGAALAADLPAVVPPPVPPPVEAHDWTGPYAGISGGWGFGTTHQFEDDSPSPDFNWDGAVVGGTVGINWQGNAFVFGLEADVSWSNIRGVLPDSGAWGCVPECHNRVDWFGTARGRIGLTMDRFLPYLTAGAAFGGIYADFGSCGVSCTSSTQFGWTAGAGVEMLLHSGWTAKLEYLHVDLGSHEGDDLGMVARFNVVRAGLNLHF